MDDPSTDSPNANAATDVKRTHPGVVYLALATVLTIVAAIAMEPFVLEWMPLPAALRRFAAFHPLVITVNRLALSSIIVLWFFMLGGSFGSFLNCAAYRMPRALSIVSRPSSCPSCGTPIRLQHNVPVFGWLMLRGRCAACGWSIPVRYALVEYLFGTTFLFLLVTEGFTGGWNMPEHIGYFRRGVENLWDPPPGFLMLFGTHLALLTLLMSYCLFAWDRFRVPWQLALVGMLVAVAAPWSVPYSQPESLASLRENPTRILGGQASGMIFGALLGAILSRRSPGNVRSGDMHATLLGMVLVGLMLGAKAALVVALLTAAIRAVAVPFQRSSRLPMILFITIATTLQLGFARPLSLPASLSPVWQGALVLAIAVLAGLCDGWEAMRENRESSAGQAAT